jgi:hypothetical protein
MDELLINKKLSMKVVICIILLLSASAARVEKSNYTAREAEIFKAEFNLFVDSIKPFHNDFINQFVVYVAHFYQINPKDEELCFTLGYILNEFQVKSIAPDYVYYHNDEIVLIRCSNLTADIFKELQFKKIEKEDSVRIANKLFPAESGGFTYTSQGLVYCKEKERIARTFYSNADEIPLERSIYGNFPVGYKIELIERGEEKEE